MSLSCDTSSFPPSLIDDYKPATEHPSKGSGTYNYANSVVVLRMCDCLLDDSIRVMCLTYKHLFY